MSTYIRKEIFDSSQTLIIKIGSNVLTRGDDSLDLEIIQQLARQIDALISTGRRVVVVSSGAVAAGIGILGLTEKPQSLPELQASAAAGQPHLMSAWGDALRQSGHQVGQILLTMNDFRSRRRYLNVRNTIRTLLSFGIVPIINENDSVSIEEIALGDNDQLASMIAALVPKPLLVILSGIDGLYDGSPASENSKLISIVARPDDSLQKNVSNEQSSRGRGGMAAKLRAILNATTTGESVILANGRSVDVLEKVSRGEDVGTLFVANRTTIPAWKKWIGYTVPPEGKLVLDDGATTAVIQNGKSLLAVGIREVHGEFEHGASVQIVSPSSTVIGRGLVNYSSEDIRRIIGLKSDRIQEVLGHVPYGEVIHRDNLVVTD